MKISKKNLIMGAYIVASIGILWLLALGIKKMKSKPAPTEPSESDGEYALLYAEQIAHIGLQAATENRDVSAAEQKEINTLLKMIADLGFQFYDNGDSVGVKPK